MAEIHPDEAERLIGLLADSLEQGHAFVIEEMPQVVQEMILFYRATNTALACLLLACCLALLACAKHIYQKWSEDCKELCVIPATITMLPFIGFIFSTIESLKWWIAPKFAVFSYLLDLL